MISLRLLFLHGLVLSWNLDPKNIIFDEINWCNINFLLGELFTTMGLEHHVHLHSTGPCFQVCGTVIEVWRSC